MRKSPGHPAPITLQHFHFRFCRRHPFKTDVFRRMLTTTGPKVVHGHMKLTDPSSATIKARHGARDMSVGSAHVCSNSPCCIFLDGYLPPCPAHIWRPGFLSHTDAQIREAETQRTEFKWIHSAFDRYWKWILPPVKTNNAFPLEVH